MIDVVNLCEKQINSDLGRAGVFRDVVRLEHLAFLFG